MTEDGRRSFFSGYGPNEQPDSGGEEGDSGAVVIDCSRCHRSTNVPISDAFLRLVSLSIWIPGRSFDRRLRCPACHRRAWVGLHLS